MKNLDDGYKVDSPEFRYRCENCGRKDCNCEGGFTLDGCIRKNGIDFKSMPRDYTARKQKIIVPLLQTLPSGTDWRKQA